MEPAGDRVTTTYIGISVLWLLFLISLLWAMFADHGIRQCLRKNGFVLLCVIGLAVVTSVLASRHMFYGQEYEDGFEYTYSGLFMARNVEARAASLNPVCLDGSLSQCSAIGLLSHPTGLATLVSWMSRVAGDSLKYVSVISAVFWTICAAIIFLLARQVGVHPVPAFAASATCLTIPMWFALATSSLAEPTATGITACALFASYQIIDRPPPHMSEFRSVWPYGLLLCFAVSIGACVKREGLLLALVIPALHLLRTQSPRRTWREARHPWLVLLLACSSGAMLALLVTLGRVASVEAVRPGSAPPFAFMHLFVLAPKYLAHFLEWQSYAFLWPFVLLGVLSRTHWRETVPLLGIVALYALIFCSFGHTYYFAQYGEIPWFHFQRYSLQLAPWLALSIAFGADGVWQHLGRVKRGRGIARWASVALFCLAVCWSVVLGARARLKFSEDEYATRVAPATAICQSTPTNSWILTLEPVLFGLFCGPERRIIAFDSLGAETTLRDLMSRVETGRVVHCETTNDDRAERDRYPLAFAVLQHFELVPIENTEQAGYRLYEMRRRDNDKKRLHDQRAVQRFSQRDVTLQNESPEPPLWNYPEMIIFPSWETRKKSSQKSKNFLMSLQDAPEPDRVLVTLLYLFL